MEKMVRQANLDRGGVMDTRQSNCLYGSQMNDMLGQRGIS